MAIGIKIIVKWIKRATGFGYAEQVPLSYYTDPVKKAREIKDKSDKLVCDMEKLEVELRRIGIRPTRRGGNDD